VVVQLESEVDFQLSLENFEGPFDLLLTLIGRHELDITQVALAQVTEEFLNYVKQLDARQEMESVSEFLVVAATLIDMKLASLLPRGEVVDSEDVALLEARDLLFARLLQYRAFKELSAWFNASFELEAQRIPRVVRLEGLYRGIRPELRWDTSLAEFQLLARSAFTPREIPSIGLTHLHAPKVSIREQVEIIVERLRSVPSLSFYQLIADTKNRAEFVARFLGVLELYQIGAISIMQPTVFGEITLCWEAEDFDSRALDGCGVDYER
jgi:segregation and condensation protein A